MSVASAKRRDLLPFPRIDAYIVDVEILRILHVRVDIADPAGILEQYRTKSVLLLLELDNRETGIRDKVQPKRSQKDGRREAYTEAVFI